MEVQTTTPLNPEAEYWKVTNHVDKTSYVKNHLKTIRALIGDYADVGTCTSLTESTDFKGYHTFYRLAYGAYGHRTVEPFPQVVARIKDKFGLHSLPFPKFKETAHSLEFMLDGANCILYDLSKFTNQEIKDHGYTGAVDSSLVNYLYGYRGIEKLIDILFSKANISLENGHFFYSLKDNKGNVDKRYTLSNRMDAIHGILDISARGTGYNIYGSIKTPKQLGEWLLQSKYLGLEDFHIEGNRYVGPENYYDCPLFKEIVTQLVIALQNNQSVDAPPASPTREVHKKLMEYLEKYNTAIYKDLSQRSESLSKKALISSKYSFDLIKRVFGSKVSPFVVDERFREKISKKCDFDFFLLSSSEETIEAELRKTFPEFCVVTVEA